MGDTAAEIMRDWPEQSRVATRIVVETYGQPHEATASQLTWHRVGSWKRVVATRVSYAHDFPRRHVDVVESFIDYRVPVDKVSAVVAFDGSVVVERTAGEVSARCHDEQANFLALNLMHDIITGAKSVEEARQYYVQEVLDYRRKRPTPYMEGFRFGVPLGGTADPDVPLITEEELEKAIPEGESA